MQYNQEGRAEEERKFWGTIRERIGQAGEVKETQKKKKLVLPILLAAGLLIAGICAALYLILN